MAQIKIAIDAAHGFSTGGKRTCKLTKDIGKFKKGEQIHEHEISVYICSRVSKILKELGYDIVKSAWNDEVGTDDADVGLTVRQSVIKKANCDYSVSIHLNACGDGATYNSGNGTEVLIHNNSAKVGDSKKMAEFVLSELIKGTKQTNRGVKTMELAMCNCPRLGTKASVLIECAFMTNLNEVNNMITHEEFWDECADEIAKGIDNYIKSITPVTTATPIKKENPVQKVTTAIKNKVTKPTAYVKVLTETLNVRSNPTWDTDDVCGVVKKDDVFTVVKKVDGGFYLLKSGLYVTSNPKYIELFYK